MFMKYKQIKKKMGWNVFKNIPPQFFDLLTKVKNVWKWLNIFGEQFCKKKNVFFLFAQFDNLISMY